MSLAAGDHVGPYEVIGLVGAGGMGEVYKARDTRLGRTVALKALPGDKVADANRRQRFLHEAQAASALNHPSIVTVFDWLEHDGAYFLVMEFLSGKTLDQIIPQKGLRAGEALKLAEQIADALAKAHAAGIVHRDIKPGNIMVSEQGRVKVLDFGLAKLQERAETSPEEMTLTQRDLTDEGIAVGSAPYMSPEQAEGRKVDARSDIFSFGVVLYQMLTGRRAFDGGSRAATIAAVLNKEPAPIAEIAPAIPRELERVVSRCLRKDLERRSQSMAEIRLTLEELKQDVESGTSSAGTAAMPAQVPKRSRVWVYGAGALVGVSLLLAGWAAYRLTTQAPAARYSLRQITRDEGWSGTPALSPDGKLLAYASNRANGSDTDIWLQHVSGGDPIRLTSTPAPEMRPRFSPDGTQIMFQRGTSIWVMPVLGGQERLIAKEGNRGSFSPDGKWIAYQTTLGYSAKQSQVSIVAAGGGPVRTVLLEQAYFGLSWTPRGDRLLGISEDGQWWLIPISGGKALPVDWTRGYALSKLQLTFLGEWLEDTGHVIFQGMRGDSVNIWRVSLDEETGKLGTPEQLTNGTREVPGQPSRDGSIPFSTGLDSRTLYEFDLDAAHAASPGGVRRVGQPSGTVASPSASQDGTRVVYASDRLGNPDIWMFDSKTSKESVVVTSPLPEFRGILSPDGKQLVFHRRQEGKAVAYLFPLPSGPEAKFCDDCRNILMWSPDGKGVILNDRLPERMLLQDVASGKRKLLMEHPKNAIHDGVLSADGQWLIFKFVISVGRQPLYIAPVREGGPAAEQEWIRLTADEERGGKPFWAPDGQTIYFYSERDGKLCFYAQRVDKATKKPQGEAVAVRHFHDSLRPGNVANTGYGFGGNHVYLPLVDSKSNVWIAMREQ